MIMRFITSTVLLFVIALLTVNYVAAEWIGESSYMATKEAHDNFSEVPAKAREKLQYLRDATDRYMRNNVLQCGDSMYMASFQKLVQLVPFENVSEPSDIYLFGKVLLSREKDELTYAYAGSVEGAGEWDLYDYGELSAAAKMNLPTGKFAEATFKIYPEIHRKLEISDEGDTSWSEWRDNDFYHFGLPPIYAYENQIYFGLRSPGGSLIDNPELENAREIYPIPLAEWKVSAWNIALSGAVIPYDTDLDSTTLCKRIESIEKRGKDHKQVEFDSAEEAYASLHTRFPPSVGELHDGIIANLEEALFPAWLFCDDSVIKGYSSSEILQAKVMSSSSENPAQRDTGIYVDELYHRSGRYRFQENQKEDTYSWRYTPRTIQLDSGVYEFKVAMKYQKWRRKRWVTHRWPDEWKEQSSSRTIAVRGSAERESGEWQVSIPGETGRNISGDLRNVHTLTEDAANQLDIERFDFNAATIESACSYILD